MFESQEGHNRPMSALNGAHTGYRGPNHSSQSPMSPVGPAQDFPQIEVDDSVNFLRTIAYRSQAMNSKDEALEALSKDKRDARANRFMGWWYLSQENDTTRAINYLETAEESGIIDRHLVNNRIGTDDTFQEMITQVRHFTYLGEPSATGTPSSTACRAK